MARSNLPYRYPHTGWKSDAHLEPHTRLVLDLSLREQHSLTKPHTTFRPSQSSPPRTYPHTHLCVTPVTAEFLNSPQTPTGACLFLTFAPQLHPQREACKATPTPTPMQCAVLLTVQRPINE